VFGPGHTAPMVDPTITLGGFGNIPPSEAPLHECMRLAGFHTGSGVTLDAYTAPSGRTNVPPRVVVNSEGPLPPAQLVGLRVGQTTGPPIILFAYRPGRTAMRRVSHELLDSRRRRVRDVRFIQGTNASSRVSAAMHGPASAMIPARPLRARSSYTARIVWRSGGRRFRQTFRFRTGG
jgi:hypothetical protein